VVDIGGTNIRAGIVLTNVKKTHDLSKVEVHKLELWRHRDEEPRPSRDEAVALLADDTCAADHQVCHGRNSSWSLWTGG
jgi:hypothetical protein